MAEGARVPARTPRRIVAGSQNGRSVFPMTNVAIFGLGYVGTVCAAGFAANGHHVVGVDPNLTKVEMVNAGRSPVIEAGLDDLVAQGVASGRIRATTNAEEAVARSQVSMICVGTPSHTNGSL